MKVTRRNFLIGMAGIPVVSKVFAGEAPKPVPPSPPTDVVVDVAQGYPVTLHLMNGAQRSRYAQRKALAPQVHFRFMNVAGNFTGYQIDGPDGERIAGMDFERAIWSQAGDTINIDWSPKLRKS
jgi:hypothetical protein